MKAETKAKLGRIIGYGSMSLFFLVIAGMVAFIWVLEDVLFKEYAVYIERFHLTAMLMGLLAWILGIAYTIRKHRELLGQNEALLGENKALVEKADETRRHVADEANASQRHRDKVDETHGLLMEDNALIKEGMKEILGHVKRERD